MKLISFAAQGIHGYLRYDISFKSNVTFLIGINGTGKTSVLKMILGLLSPSFSYLNQLKFEDATLIVEAKKSLIELKVKMIGEDEFEFRLSKDGVEEDYAKINKYIGNSDQNSEEAEEEYSNIRNQFDQLSIVKKIREISRPLYFLGLDRRIYEGFKIDRIRSSYNIRRRLGALPQNDPLNISLMELQEIIYDYFRSISAEQPELNDKFKNQILMNSLEFIDDYTPVVNLSLQEIDEKRAKTIDAMGKLHVTNDTEIVDLFFDKFKAAIQKLAEADKTQRGKKDSVSSEYMNLLTPVFNNQYQLKNITKIIELSQNYQKEINALYEPIERFKNIINAYYIESNKRLIINNDGKLQVEFKNGNVVSIFEISSGEKQILAMIGSLVFYEERYRKDIGVFIIDEPEISLHLAWQEIFMKTITDASPNTQFVIATHSPSILAGFGEENCEDLAKYNME